MNKKEQLKNSKDNSSQYKSSVASGFEELNDEDAEDSKPQVLYTKYQRLKNSATKLARVMIIDENPPRARADSDIPPATENKKTQAETLLG